ncbi:hypothetical protein OG21DRAFT_1427047, partial [Imleria badia]
VIMEDPNLAVLPDFTTNEYKQNRALLRDAGMLNLQAVEVLTHQWIMKNDKDKAKWNRRREEEAIAAADTRQHEQELRVQWEEEEALIVREECKKNKAKFAPIPKVPVPSDPIILPSQVALRKLQQHKFCELWYFTNAGLDEADTSLSYALDDDTLSFVTSTDGLPTLVPTSLACDKASVVQDEHLSIEQFGESAPCMIPFMFDNGWDQAHVQMHVEFWGAIERHG